MVRCSQCQKELTLITGHATIRLYRCGGCGSQQMLPGDPTAAVAQPGPDVADPIGAAAALIAANPAQPKGSPKLIVVAVAIALGLLLLVLAS